MSEEDIISVIEERSKENGDYDPKPKDIANEFGIDETQAAICIAEAFFNELGL